MNTREVWLIHGETDFVRGGDRGRVCSDLVCSVSWRRGLNVPSFFRLSSE